MFLTAVALFGLPQNTSDIIPHEHSRKQKGMSSLGALLHSSPSTPLYQPFTIAAPGKLLSKVYRIAEVVLGCGRFGSEVPKEEFMRAKLSRHGWCIVLVTIGL